MGVNVFQSTLPQGERLYYRSVYGHLKIYFNPRSHKGSDDVVISNIDPALIFQSTLPQGERPLRWKQEPERMEFQSPLPQGERLDHMAYSIARWVISIHAPTRGATVYQVLYYLDTKFQSTLPQGERRCYFQFPLRFRHFNPRSHKGSDGLFTKPYAIQINFNPRSHKGSDNKTAPQQPFPAISIHAPTRGATVTEIADGQDVHISIHAPTRGATARLNKRLYRGIFQSTLPQGERRRFHYH